MDRQLVSYFFLVLVAAILQNFNWLNLWGVRINLILILIIALAFVARNWLEYFLMVLFAAIFLKTQDGWDWTLGAFILTSALVYWGYKFAPWRSIINYLVLVLFATIFFYFVANRGFAMT